jgi:hypothetical protein
MMSVQQLYQLNERLKQIFQTDQHFGGKSIIVVGHFRQLPPVGGGFVFKIPSFLSLGHIHGNYLWENFQLFELVEIMRQKGDAAFCEALNNMAEGVMTPEDIKLIKSREVTLTIQPDISTIRLYRTNSDCQEFNTQFHDTLPGEVVISKALDRVQGHGSAKEKEKLLEYANTFSTADADGLPHRVNLKIGATYFISTNVDVSDGLFNGSTGILRAIEFGSMDNEQVPTGVLMEFGSDIVGIGARNRYKDYLVNNNIPKTSTPIKRFKRVLQKSGKNQHLQLVRCQIPLVAANGMTIHKSQGSSLKAVVVCLKRKMTRALLYVGCSRSTTITGLFLEGVFEAPEPPPPDDPVTQEMARLRSNPLKLTLRFFQDLANSTFKLLFHNVQSLKTHLDDILADHCYMASDILAFVEPMTKAEDSICLPEFTHVHRIDCPGQRSSYGSSIFSKYPELSVGFDSFPSSFGHIDFTYFIVKTVSVL